MAVPKSKQSKSRTNKRFANYKATAATLVECPHCHELVAAHRVCKNLKAVLEAAGASLEKAVKTTCFLDDMGDFTAFNEVYSEYFTGKPARSCVAVKTLPKNALVEVEVIAEKE